jgi:hypothetical protein
MINKIFIYIIQIIIVFIQVFFIDNFDYRFGLIFIPYVIYYFKNDYIGIFNYSFLVFIFYDFFKNNFVGISLLVFLIINSAINQMSKIWDKNLLILIRILAVFLVFYFFNFGYLNISFIINLFLFGIIILFNWTYKSGYFRFN